MFLTLHFCVLAGNRAYPGSEFVVANPLAKWKKWSQMKLTLAKVLAIKYQQVVLYLTLCPLCLLIAFVNSLNPDQVQQNVGSDLALNCLTPIWY